MNIDSSAFQLDKIRQIGLEFEAALRTADQQRIEDLLRLSGCTDACLLLCELLAHEVTFLQSRNMQGLVSLLYEHFASQAEVVDAICGAEDAIARAHQIQNKYIALTKYGLDERAKELDANCVANSELRAAVRCLFSQNLKIGDLRKSIQEITVHTIGAQFIADELTATINVGPNSGYSTVPNIEDSSGTPPKSPLNFQTLLEGSLPNCNRFRVLREIGAGGNGVVYEAWDTEQSTRVALKVLRRRDCRSVELFKREFRSLTDILHPNLASVYELFLVEPFWFLTMELVQGVPFKEFFENKNANRTQYPLGFDVREFRATALQLAQAINALHQAKLLHRDLKSSNVLVTDSGKVVVLDFGLAAMLDEDQLHQVTDQAVAGTLSYISPEQIAAQVISPASDWYSFGTMLYEVLAGQLPFSGNPLQVMLSKQQREPLPARQVAPQVPADLSALCAGLLQRNPQHRPNPQAILQFLGMSQPISVSLECPTGHASSAPVFVGRQSLLEQLQSAFEAVCQGKPRNLLIAGSPGLGKSALVRQFLRDISLHADCVVLSGRCYERESVPYKALDSIVDCLATYLSSLPAHQVEVFLPLKAYALARVFPALRRVVSIQKTTATAQEDADTLAMRRVAFQALRELLCRLGNKLSLIITIDDLQWGDLDSAILLGELVRAPDAPVMLVIGTVRSGDLDDSNLGKFWSPNFHQSADAPWRKLSMEPLTNEEALCLIESLTGENETFSESERDTIIREAKGNPFFICELVHYFRARRDHGPHGPKQALDLDGLIISRICNLPAGARRLVEIIAVSGRPLYIAESRRAADSSVDELKMLQAAHLVRTSGADANTRVECYHDCIRETVVAQLSKEKLQAYHRSLANTLADSNNAEPEHLALHFEGCGEESHASHYYQIAAEAAANLLAFDRAAQLFDLAISFAQCEEADLSQLYSKRAAALANAGRGREAAQAYVDACRGAPQALQCIFRRRAAEQLLTSGHLSEGLESLHQVLDASGMRYPSTQIKALLRLLMFRIQLLVRGLSFRSRPAERIDSELLSRIDTCWSVSVGMGLIDPIRAACFVAYGLLLSLRAGEPYRVARALAMEAIQRCIEGERARKSVASLLARTAEITAEINSAHAFGLLTLARGFSQMFLGNFRAGLNYFDSAEQAFRECSTGVSWELSTARGYWTFCCFWLGEFLSLQTRLSGFVENAEDRGDRYALMNLSGPMFDMLLILEDDLAIERRHILESSFQQGSQQEFFAQQFSRFIGEIHFQLYTQDGPMAWEVARIHRVNIRSSLLARVQFVRIVTAYLCGRSALVAAAGNRSLLGEAEREAQRILAEKVAWGRPLALQIQAGIAWQNADLPRAHELFAAAADGFDEIGFVPHAVASRRRCEEINCSQTNLLPTAFENDERLKALGAKVPAKVADIFAPHCS